MAGDQKYIIVGERFTENRVGCNFHRRSLGFEKVARKGRDLAGDGEFWE